MVNKAYMCSGSTCPTPPLSPWASWELMCFLQAFTPTRQCPAQPASAHRQALAAGQKLHWHIDYLRVEAELLGAVLLFNEEKEGECRFVQKLLHLPEACLPVPGFGASDCGCGGHLVYLPSLPPDLVSLGDAIHDIELGPAESLAFFYAGD